MPGWQRRGQPHRGPQPTIYGKASHTPAAACGPSESWWTDPATFHDRQHAHHFGGRFAALSERTSTAPTEIGERELRAKGQI